MIYRVLTNNKLRERLINKGLERAKKIFMGQSRSTDEQRLPTAAKKLFALKKC